MSTESKALLKSFDNDGLPVFGLSRLRKRYRRLFVDMINSGELRLEKVTACPCGNARFVNISNKDRFGLPFHTKICAGCGLICTDPRLSEGSMERYYREVYYPLVLGIPPGAAAGNIVSETQGEVIFSLTAPFVDMAKGPLRVLEIGCAGGENLKRLSEMMGQRGAACILYGTEYEEYNAVLAGEKGVNLIKGGIEEACTQGMKFDIVILSHVLEHIPDLNAFLARVRESLDEQGVLFVEVPGVNNTEMLSGGWYMNYVDYTVHSHVYNFNLASLRHILELNGFELAIGDEFVRAVFRVSGKESAAPDCSSNCESVLHYLENVLPENNHRPGSVYGLLRRRLKRAYYGKLRFHADY